ncbi:hypothetical protein PsYK624_140940 [Phanerochaete sordida]|uniref:F-box domain-containing protein n=1 Tax=Phanerochaete sordida TaxID=48140 RepID=A0A9P3LL31_9APHY|nr:hypothetical protein PsYK624_140940 [Phanerochaete sordida]
MHPCLHIDEVIENIASHVEDNRTLTRLALVCRAFVEPATDALWAHLSGLEPLLSCLSSDLMGPSQRSYRALTIRAPPTLAGWARFRHYARKVKSLHIRPANLRKLQDNGGTTILAEHHPDGVLPNLKHLRWHEQWGSETLALAFMRPSLSTLTYVGNTTQALRTVMEHVRANLPQLNDFTCSYDSLYLPPDDSIVNEFSDTILALGNLTTFLYTSNVLRSDAVLHLSRIPHLTTLSVVLDSETHELWINPRSGGFCALTNLTLRVCPMEGGLSPCN